MELNDNNTLPTKKRGRPIGSKTKKKQHGKTKYDGKTKDEKRIIKNTEAGQAIQIFKQRAKIKNFLKKIACGQNKISAFKETFPESESWSTTKVWRHVNCILLRNSSSNYLKLYRNKWLECLEQKKVDMLLLLEQEVIFNDDRSIRISDKLKAIETFAKLAGFMAPTPTLVQQINVETDTQKELLNIFGIETKETQLKLENKTNIVIDAEIIDNNDFNLDIENDE